MNDERRGTIGDEVTSRERVDRPEDFRGLPPIRFSVRTLLLVVAMAAGMFALAAQAPTYWVLTLGLVGATVALHLAGAHLGARLRELPLESRPSDVESRAAVRVPSEEGRLGRKAPVPRRVAFGAAVGGVIGWAASTTLPIDEGLPAWPSRLAAGVAAAVIGAFLAWLIGSFWLVFRDAWTQAADAGYSPHFWERRSAGRLSRRKSKTEGRFRA